MIARLLKGKNSEQIGELAVTYVDEMHELLRKTMERLRIPSDEPYRAVHLLFVPVVVSSSRNIWTSWTVFSWVSEPNSGRR